MTEVARFFDAVLYSESDQAEVQNRFRREGVLFEAGNRLAAGAPGGMFVSLATGEAMVEGFWYQNTASLNIAVANNTSGSTRVDLLVLRLNRVLNTLSAAIVQGTPGAGTPALTQIVGGTWEFPIASITVPTGTTSAITGGMIGDMRTWSRMVRYGEELVDNIIGVNHLIDGSVSNLLLNYKALADIASPGGIGAGVFFDVIPAQSFVVSSNCRSLIITVQLSALVTSTSSNEATTNIIIDNTTRYQIAPHHISTTAGLGGSSGAVIIPALSAGSHNIKVQIYTTVAYTQWYLRPASQPSIEGLAIQVLELRK